MAVFRHFYPLFRRNSSFLILIVSGGFLFDYAFNRSTRYYFYEVMNKENGFNALQESILARQASQADEEDED